MSCKQKRLIVLFVAFCVFALAVTLLLVALKQNIRYFRTPADLTSVDMHSGAKLRLGGLVQQGSVIHDADKGVEFIVTDQIKAIKVIYNGILPDLFREGQGVVVEGHWGASGIFIANNVLAKHDEKYMPKDVADRLKAEGLWQKR